MKVAVTGATGFVGSRLVERLQADGHQILVLTRNPEKGRRTFPKAAFPNVEIVAYTPDAPGPWQKSLTGCDGVANLAGEPIAEGRWTSEHKEAILKSRQLVTHHLVDAIAQANPRPSVLVNASAIGYYGSSETAAFDENSPAANDFLGSVCQTWEAEAHRVETVAPGVRLVIIRTGIVLDAGGGALERMIPPFRLYGGGPIGSGQQWFSWIHRDDLVSLYLAALTNPAYQGVYNGTAPNPVRMKEFCNVLGQVLRRPSWLPVPGFVITALLGEGAQVVLEGQQVLPRHLLSQGFQYQYANLKPALSAIVQP